MPIPKLRFDEDALFRRLLYEVGGFWSPADPDGCPKWRYPLVLRQRRDHGLGFDQIAIRRVSLPYDERSTNDSWAWEVVLGHPPTEVFHAATLESLEELAKEKAAAVISLRSLIP